jgi:hypothetical protein
MSLEEHRRTSLADVSQARASDPRPGRRYMSLHISASDFAEAMMRKTAIPLVSAEGAKVTRHILGRPKNQPAYRQLLKSKY